MLRFIGIGLVSAFTILTTQFAKSYASDEILFSIFEAPPYGIYLKDGKKDGYFVQILQELSQEYDIKMQIKLQPIKRTTKTLITGENHCSILASSKFVKTTYTWIEATGLRLEAGIIPQKGIRLRQYEELYGLKIGVVQGTSFNNKFDTDEKIIREMSTDYPSSVRQLATGRVQAIAGAVSTLYYNAKLQKIPIDRYFDDPFVFNSLDIGFVCNKEYADQNDLSKLKNAVKEMRENGRLKQIHDNFIKGEVLG